MKYKQLYKFYYNDKSLYNEIYNQRFNSESTYRFHFKVNDDNAFVVITPEILSLITDIRKHNANISKLISPDKFPQIAIEQFEKKCLIDEIKLSNEMEGVHSTRKEISDALSSKFRTKENRRIYGITQKYKLLMTDEKIKLHTCEDIRMLYDELLLPEIEIDDTENIPDGVLFRKNRVAVQNDRHEEIHIGLMPETSIITTMTQALELINSNTCEPLIAISVFHYMFGYIHPFYDGNGRMSRFISSYLISKELEPITAYRLAYTIKSSIKNYYKYFDDTNNKINKGDITAFVIYFLETLLESIINLYDEINIRIYKLRNYTKYTQKLVLDKNASDLLFILIQNALFADFGLNVTELSDILHKSTSTIRNTLNTLMTNHLVSFVTSGRSKYYTSDLNTLENL